MAIQELDIKIRHRPGRSNANADALSRAPLEQRDDRKEGEAAGVIARIECQEPEMSTLQQQDPELAPVMKFLEARFLPEDDVEARRVVLTVSQFTMEGGISTEWPQMALFGSFHQLPIISHCSSRPTVVYSGHTWERPRCSASCRNTSGGEECEQTLPDGPAAVWCVPRTVLEGQLEPHSLQFLWPAPLIT